MTRAVRLLLATMVLLCVFHEVSVAAGPAPAASASAKVAASAGAKPAAPAGAKPAASAGGKPAAASAASKPAASGASGASGASAASGSAAGSSAGSAAGADDAFDPEDYYYYRAPHHHHKNPLLFILGVALVGLFLGLLIFLSREYWAGEEERQRLHGAYKQPGVYSTPVQYGTLTYT
eukprot:CAMPEP_0114560590 /NCGR_PEP_ID=MMETSP0114-20121206/11539_1 /TAXON_ID=31324 /ORGANISM="Goniomonas sp, Strain m" /LENGTH=177 /DNA_ID=CAMNT_0001746143 /DNA_START=20 /DNA_END=553 /DNA_ORIENTATION=-